MLSTLLLVVTFLLSVFMVAQFYVSQEATGKDTALRRLTRQIAELTNLLSLEKGKGKALEDELSALQAIARDAQDRQRAPDRTGRCRRRQGCAHRRTDQGAGRQDVAVATRPWPRSTCSTSSCSRCAGRWRPCRRRSAPPKAKDKESQARISDLGARLNVVLARQVQELQRYRSDFFGRLRELLRDRKDIRVVGDRFVFQSEVLFPSGQATMTRRRAWPPSTSWRPPSSSWSASIPAEIDWALQVDGHTDTRPHRQPAIPVQLGAVQRPRDLGREVSDQPRRPAQAPGGGGLWRVSAARGRHHAKRCCAAIAASS